MSSMRELLTGLLEKVGMSNQFVYYTKPDTDGTPLAISNRKFRRGDRISFAFQRIAEGDKEDNYLKSGLGKIIKNNGKPNVTVIPGEDNKYYFVADSDIKLSEPLVISRDNLPWVTNNSKDITSDLNVEKTASVDIVELLNKALSDEYIACLQYYYAAQSPAITEEARKELSQHSMDELQHATILKDVIARLGGTPVSDPKEWDQLANAPFVEPSDKGQELLAQQIKGEDKAIQVYHQLEHLVSDEKLKNIIVGIKEKEQEHAKDLRKLLNKRAGNGSNKMDENS